MKNFGLDQTRDSLDMPAWVAEKSLVLDGKKDSFYRCLEVSENV